MRWPWIFHLKSGFPWTWRWHCGRLRWKTQLVRIYCGWWVLLLTCFIFRAIAGMRLKFDFQIFQQGQVSNHQLRLGETRHPICSFPGATQHRGHHGSGRCGRVPRGTPGASGAGPRPNGRQCFVGVAQLGHDHCRSLSGLELSCAVDGFFFGIRVQPEFGSRVPEVCWCSALRRIFRLRSLQSWWCHRK